MKKTVLTVSKNILLRKQVNNMEDIRKERYKQTIQKNYDKFEDITQNNLYETMQEFLDKFDDKSRRFVLEELTKTRMALTNLENSIKRMYFKM